MTDELANRRFWKQSACASSPEGHRFDEWPGTWGTCERCGLTVLAPGAREESQKDSD